MNLSTHYLFKAALSLGMAAMLPTSMTQAGEEAIKNVQRPAAGNKTPIVFGFGGEKNQEFMLDGKPFQIRGAEIHPQRIPREYWRHRIQTAKAMGLNTIAFYTFWNDFEQPDGSFDFKTGRRDIGAFLKLCQEEGMWVLFRPGPYVCGEWDLGGIPHYLLKDPNAKLRTTEDETFMKAQKRYLDAIAEVAKPYLAQKGGPILMTQLENEYGSYQRKDKKYMEWLRDYWTKKGFTPQYTSDGASEGHLRDVTLPGVAVGLDPGKSQGHWDVANKMNPNVPVFSSESYPGWLRHWGEGNWAPTPSIVNDVRWYMNEGKSFSLFVFHGGTNFGFTAGANNGGRGKYQADLTSYDYGSPVDEHGRMNEHYTKMREIILEKLPEGANVPAPPADIPSMEIPEFTPVVHAGLWEFMPRELKKKYTDSPYFEEWGQNQGLAIYKTSLPAGGEETLKFTNLSDYGQVYVDGAPVGILDRGQGQKSVTIPARTKAAVLEVLVEGMGHINFHIDMEKDRKGIYGPVTLGDKELKGWTVRPMPLLSKSITEKAKGKGPGGKRQGAHFRAVIDLENPQDTFLDMSKYVKGYLWVNGHNMGRYWNIGPQLRLYVPATILKKGKNTIDILDLHMTEPKPIRGMKERNKEPGKVQTENLDNQW